MTTRNRIMSVLALAVVAMATLVPANAPANAADKYWSGLGTWDTATPNRS